RAHCLVGQLVVQFLVGEVTARLSHVDQHVDADDHFFGRARTNQRTFNTRRHSYHLIPDNKPITPPLAKELGEIPDPCNEGADGRNTTHTPRIGFAILTTPTAWGARSPAVAMTRPTPRTQK